MEFQVVYGIYLTSTTHSEKPTQLSNGVTQDMVTLPSFKESVNSVPFPQINVKDIINNALLDWITDLGIGAKIGATSCAAPTCAEDVALAAIRTKLGREIASGKGHLVLRI